MSVRVKVTKNQLPAIAAKLPIARRTILGKRGVEMVNVARRYSRIDKGDMIQGWNLIETNSGVILDNPVPHTIYNEYGTRYMSAQPMARPAAEQVFPLIKQDFENLEEHIRP